MATVSLPLSLQPGPPHNYGPATIAAGVTQLTVTISREDLNIGTSAEIVTLTTEISVDGGQTWNPGPGFGTARGIVINRKTGLPFDTSGFGPTLVPSPSLIRGTVTVTEAFSTTLTITTA